MKHKMSAKLREINEQLYYLMFLDSINHNDDYFVQKTFESIHTDTELLLEALNTFIDEKGMKCFFSSIIVFYILKNIDSVDIDVLNELRRKILCNSELARIIVFTDDCCNTFLDLLLSNSNILLSYKEKTFVMKELLCSKKNLSDNEPVVLEINKELIEVDIKGQDFTNNRVKNNYSYSDFFATFIINGNFSNAEKKYYAKLLFTDEEWKLYMKKFGYELTSDNKYDINEWHLYDKEKQKWLLNDYEMQLYAETFGNNILFFSYLKMIRLFIMLYNGRPFENNNKKL